MFHIIVNPAGASGMTLKKWHQAEEIFQKLHADYKVHLSSVEFGIERIVRDLTSGGTDTDIVIAGGDGSLNEAVNGIMDFSRTRIGLIPCGSGNDLARALEFPQDLETVVHTIAEGKTVRRNDVGILTYHNRYDRNGVLLSEEPYERKFNISAGIGFDAAICADAEHSDMKKILNKVKMGKLIYIFTALHTIFNTPRTKAQIITPEGTREYSELLLAVVMNLCYEGGGFRFAPDAKGSDGILNLCAADHLSQFDFFRIFPYAYSGNHVKFNGVYISEETKVRIRTEIPLWVHTDGEIRYMSSDISADLLPGALQMLI